LAPELRRAVTRQRLQRSDLSPVTSLLVTEQGDRLRPARVLSAAAHAGRRDWWQILAVAIPVSVISAGLEIVLEHYLDPSDAPLSISATLAATGVSILGTVLLSGLVCGLVGATQHGRERRTFADTVRSLPWKRLVMADILVTLTVIIGLVLFVLPGLAALTYLAVVGPVIEIEHRQVLSAFRRSVHLVRQHVWLVILLGTVPLSLAGELEAVAPEPDRAGEVAEFLLIRGVAMGLVEACLALLLVEVCFQLTDSDRRNGTARSPEPDEQLAASRYRRMLTARAITSPRMASEPAACIVIAALAQRASGITSVGLNAVALVKPR
jgi:hypothetical protein